MTFSKLGTKQTFALHLKHPENERLEYLTRMIQISSTETKAVHGKLEHTYRVRVV